MEPRDVFISHVEEDAGMARALAQELRAQHLSTWSYDEDGVAGISYLTQIYEAIGGCRTFTLIASPKSVRAHQVISEVEQAHEGEKVIVAVRVGMTHEEFLSSSAILRMACGTAVTVSTDERNLAEIAKRIVESLRFTESEREHEEPPSRLSESKQGHRTAEEKVEKRRLFWTTTPGILTSLSVVLAILIGVIAFVNMSSPPPPPSPDPVPPNDAQKAEYLARYAPRVLLHSQEQYWPASVEWSFHFLHRDFTDAWRLITNERLKEPSSVLAYFHGADPNKQWTTFPLRLDEVPAYAFWHEVDSDTVDLFYYFYHPYSRGTEAYVTGKKTFFDPGTVVGSHVGDWEHVTVRLRQDAEGRFRPSDAKELVFSAGAASVSWRDVLKVPPEYEHPIVFSQKHSHELFLSARDAGLRGETTEWNTWTRLECFDYDAMKGLGPTWRGTWPKWLERDKKDRSVGSADPASGPATRWGNDAREKYLGRWRLAAGPKGPADLLNEQKTTTKLD